jgi:hypothetical protein
LKKERQDARLEKRKKQVGFKQDSIKEESLSPVRSPSPMKGEEEKAGSDYTSSDEDGKGVTIKGAAQYLSYQPKADKSKNDPRNRNINEERYFKNILKLEPQLERGYNLKMQREKLYNDFKHKYKSSNNAFLNE